jgi:hypothetical protein
MTLSNFELDAGPMPARSVTLVAMLSPCLFVPLRGRLETHRFLAVDHVASLAACFLIEAKSHRLIASL